MMDIYEVARRLKAVARDTADTIIADQETWRKIEARLDCDVKASPSLFGIYVYVEPTKDDAMALALSLNRNGRRVVLLTEDGSWASR